MKDGETSSYTELVILVQAGILGCGIIFGILFLIFAQLKASNFIFTGCLIAVGLLIFGFVWLCKKFLDFVNRILKVEELTKYRNDYLIAFGTFGILSAILRVFPYFLKFSVEAYAFTTSVYIISTIAIYCFFVLPTFDNKCTWRSMDDEKTYKKFLCAVVLINLVLLIVSIRIAVEYNDIETRNGIIALQLFCTLPFAVFFADFAFICWVGVELINVDRGWNVVAVQPVDLRRRINEVIANVEAAQFVEWGRAERNEATAQPVESERPISAKPEPEPISKIIAPKPNCNICSFPYTETGIHTPRFLITCGHTICEQCAGKLLNAKMQNILVCPFCQKPTVVIGSAGALPKNFALLEYKTEVAERIQDINKTVPTSSASQT